MTGPAQPDGSSPRVLCIAGSPRRHGNSEQLLDACIRGIQAEGGTVEKLVVADYSPKPCQGCNACSLTGECVIRDRMREIYPMLDAADAIVVASPVFFATVPAVLKALYDRCQPYWARYHVLGETPPSPRRPGALLLARGGGDPFGFQAAVYTTKSVFAVLGVDYSESLKAAGLDSPSDTGRHPDVLAEAEEIGRSITRRAGQRRPVADESRE